MPYVTETVTTLNNGRVKREAQMDLNRFAKDVAKEIGGKLLPIVKEDMDQDRRRVIQIGTENLVLTIPYYVPAAKMRVTFYITAPDVKHDERDFYSKDHKTVDATVAPDGRTIERIVADIKKRVIEANKDALAAQRKHAEAIRDAQSSIVRLAAALAARCPVLGVRVNEKERKAEVWGGKGHYVSATLNADGAVSVSHLGSMGMGKFERIMAILNEKGDE